MSLGRAFTLGLAIVALACACSDKQAPRGQARGGIARQIKAPGASAPSYAPAASPVPGALDYLSGYAGRSVAQIGLWDTRPLHERLIALLGDNYDRFLGQLAQGRLQAEAGVYYVAVRGAGAVAAVVMDPREDAIYAVEQDATGRREFLERSHKPPLPGEVARLIASMPLR